MELELIQRAIMEDAARFANELIVRDEKLLAILPATEFYMPGRFDPAKRKERKRRFYAEGEVFRFDPGRTNRGGMTLSMDESMKKQPPEIINRLHEIAGIAMRQALRVNGDKFGFLVALQAWDGINYFDQFSDVNEQTRLI
jgi:hypothetical protein